MQYIIDFIQSLIHLTNEMSFWLLIGFLFAGILNVVVSNNLVSKYLGKSNLKSIINASLLGVPLPLCSCGVIPTGVAIHQNGSSKSAAVSFLISTPQTGVDSIMVTYSLLGLPFAIVRPIIALFTGIAGGLFTKKLLKDDDQAPVVVKAKKANTDSRPEGNVVSRIAKYAFKDFMDDISKWLVIGLLLAAAIDVLVPEDFFATQANNKILQMFIILAASIPLYVCATGSVPIAAVLLLKGISPGAALVFLMAGPATNAATITVIGNSFGRKALIGYLVSIISGAVMFGLIIDYLLPSALFLSPILSHAAHGNHHEMLPMWLSYGSSIVLSILLLFSLIRKMGWIKPAAKNNTSDMNTNANSTVVKVEGMTCNHCKANVENALNALEGIEILYTDIQQNTVEIAGENIKLDVIKTTVEKIGYKFAGKI